MRGKLVTDGPDELVQDIVGCARCHGDGHEGLTFKRLTHPVADPDGRPIATHWATCPTTGEPILHATWKVP